MRFVFTIVLFIFILCVVTTITSFNEIPLDILANPFKVNQIKDICSEFHYKYPISSEEICKWRGRKEGRLRSHGEEV